MSPVLDVRTLVLVYVGIRFGQAAVLLYLWRVQRNYPPARDWALGALLSAAGLLLFALRGLAPPWLTELASNALLLPGTMLFDFGIARAAGRRPSRAQGLSWCAVAAAAMLWFYRVTPSYPAQVVTQNAFFVSLELYVAYSCLSGGGGGSGGRRLTFRLIGALYLVLALACSWRVAAGVFGLAPSTLPDLPRTLWIAISLVTFPMITVLLTLHTSQRLQDEINDQARHDTLTGTYNRRALDEFADREWSKAVRHGLPFSVLTVDIDHFKDFNDRHGHQTGDATLVRVSETAQTALRASDIWCRYGGEEFIALLPGTSMAQACAIAERLRAAVERATIATPTAELSVSVSIGVAERTSVQARWNEVIAASDAALYQAKAAGRNRVVASGGA